MAEVMGVYAPKRKPTDDEPVCLREVRAELVSLGGAIVLMICLVITAALFIVLQLPQVTAPQRVIIAGLVAASWLYLLDSVTERLRLVDHCVEYHSLFGRRRCIPLKELRAMLLIHEGFNLERGMESLEFRRDGKKADRVALGPCWQRHKLESFLHSVEEALDDPHLLEEVR